jgi:hypothetical protein
VPDTSWDDLGIESPNSIDPSVRLVVSLFETLDFEQLFRRTGIRVGPDGMLAKQRIGLQGRLENQRLPLFVELGPDDRSATLSALMSPAATGRAVGTYRAHISMSFRSTESHVGDRPARVG